MDDRPMINRLLELHSWAVFDVDDDGRVLAGSDSSGSTQLVEIGTDGAHTALTALPGACSGRYLPRERAVVVEHDTGGNERSQLSLLRLDPPSAEPVGLDALEPLVHDPDHVNALVDVEPGRVVYRTNRRNGVDFDVVVLDVDASTEHVVYDEGGLTAAVDVDGDTVAVTLLSAKPCSTQVRIAKGGVTSDITAADEYALHTSAHILPGTQTVLMSSNRGRDFRRVVTADAAGEWTTLLTADDHDIEVLPSPDGARMLVTRQVDGADALSIHGSDGAHHGDLVLPGTGVTTAVWSPDSTWLAVGLTTPTSPGDVLLVDTTDGHVRTLVDASAQMTGDVLDVLVEPTTVRVPTRDGEDIPCFVYAPNRSVDGVSGSVVVNIHGGPEGEARLQFSPINQALAVAGHIVLVPNVRGSTGYGKRWYSMDDVELRLESVLDLVDLRSWVPEVGGDPDRVAVYGGSYGGYMVLAALAMHPGLWAAGVDIVGMSSLVTFLENTSDYRRAAREREYGSLEHDRDFLHQASPLTYLHAMDTPLFVIHGANDPRVPLYESEQIKAALDDKGVPCTLRVYDDEGHGLAKRVNRLDAYPAALAFLTDQLSR